LSRRPLLKADGWSALVDMPTEEESLIRHCTLGRAEMDLIQAKRTPHNRLGLAIQLCFLRHLGRAILLGETPPAPMVAFLAEQIGINPGALAEYGRRDTNRREHAVEAQRHLGLHPPVREDRRAALTAALAAATASDKGMPIIAAFRERKSVLPATDTLDRIGRAARVVARRRMETALLGGLSSQELATLDGLLAVDSTIRQTRFAWLRASPEAPSEKNLLRPARPAELRAVVWP
jgi:TnpA family transposase